MDTENKITKAKNILIVLPDNGDKNNDLHYLTEHFCGTVVHGFSEIQLDPTQQKIYVCGDMSKINIDRTLLYIIRELSYNYDNLDKEHIQIVSLGQVPIVVSNAGVYFRRFFDADDLFHNIKAEHEFQDLTESTKPSKSLRKGIYLTEVSKEITEEKSEMLHYRLLRCSTNLSGPTDNFRDTDRTIMNAMNEAIKYVFEEKTTLNHVLAQIYENKKKDDEHPKETKAKISAHSDKTKDMPKDGLIAFCTFYDSSNFQHLKPSITDPYDWCHKDMSGLTNRHFRLKNSVKDDTLEKEFTVTLYPNSVFIIPLSTNRLYTHEIKPSLLNIDKIPTRLGYVVRCSNAEALFMDNQTYIKENGTLVKLEPMTEVTMANLKDSYREENITENVIKYNEVHFSMNLGDYQKPIY